MIALRPVSASTVYAPTPDRIARACAEYQAGWSPAECDSRLTAGVDMQVWLLAEIMRPMAVEAGLIPSVASAATEKPKTVPAVETVSSDDTLCDSAA